MNTKQREWLGWGIVAAVLTALAIFLGVTYPVPAAPSGEVEVLGTTMFDNLRVVGTSDLRGDILDGAGTLTIADNATITGTFGADGAVTLGGVTTINNNLVITGTSDLQGNVSNSLGNFTINDNLAVTGALSVAGVSLTASITEVNTLDGSPLGDHTFTIGSELTDTINVAIQLVDGNGVALAVRGAVLAYLSDDANGDSIAAAAPSGGWAIGTDGLLIPVVTNKAAWVISESDGDIDITITEAGAATWYLILVLPDGTLIGSAAITFAP